MLSFIESNLPYLVGIIGAIQALDIALNAIPGIKANNTAQAIFNGVSSVYKFLSTKAV